MAMATWSTSNRHPVSSSLIPLLEFEMASLPLLEFYCIFFTLPILLTWQSQLAIAFGKLTACRADARIFMWGTLRPSCALWDIYLRVKFPLIMVLFSQIVYPIMLSSSIQYIIKKTFGSNLWAAVSSVSWWAVHSMFENSGLKIIGYC